MEARDLDTVSNSQHGAERTPGEDSEAEPEELSSMSISPPVRFPEGLN